MIDWISDNKGPLLGFFVPLGVIIVLLCIAIDKENRENNKTYHRLLQQCLADGHKEYECVSMLKSNQQQAAPVIIPMPIYTR